MLSTKIKVSLLFALLILAACTKPGIWTLQELNTIASFDIHQLPKIINSPSNQYSNDQDAAALGKAIFFDERFSANQSMSCASCHQPDKNFTDGLAKAKGIHATGRNTQSILGVAHATWFYWDGRKDSLWAQALVPFEAADEMASSRVEVLRMIGNDPDYLKQYTHIFGPFPKELLSQTIPEKAGPWGDAMTRNNWFRIPSKIQKIINATYANIGKAIAAFEQTIPLPETKFDQYVSTLLRGDEAKANQLLTKNELAGMKLFINEEKTHCTRCHHGPLLTNQDFHNIGTGNFTGLHLDFGRYLGIQAVVQDEFNCLGQFSDAQPEDCSALRFLQKQVHGDMQGAYKTPSLRYLNKTAPYFHDGRHNTLNQVLAHYLSPQHNGSELPPITLTETEQAQLVAFLKILN